MGTDPIHETIGLAFRLTQAGIPRLQGSKSPKGGALALAAIGVRELSRG